jgi:hypothetical protein
MPAVPLGLQAYGRARGLQPETRLRNLYIEKDESGGSPDQVYRLQRPGLTRLVEFPAAIRGIYQADNVLGSLTAVVAGDTLYTTDNASFDAIGTIPTDGDQVTMAASFERLGIATAGEFWTYDGATLAAIALPDDQAIVDLAVLDSYFILGTSSGKFYWLAPGSSTVNALDFADAESLPDGLVGVRKLRDDLFFFGSRSVEVWQASGDSSGSLFTPAKGRGFDRGAQARETIQIIDNSVTWVGDDGLVYRVHDVPERISTFGIEEKIRNRTDLCSAFVVTTEGHKFYVLRIPGQGTFAYDVSSQSWCEFSTLGETVFRPHCGIDTGNGPLLADATGKLFSFDPDAVTDDGLAIERLVTGTVALSNKPVRNNSLAMEVGSLVAATYRLRYRDALDTDWTGPITVSARAGSDIVNVWRLGANRGANRTFEISTTDATKIRISGAIANEAWTA